MSIVKTMTQSDFQDGLKGNGFSYDGTNALYDYYEELSDSMEEPFEFDAIAIRCEWTEYSSLAEAYKELRYDYTYVEGEAREYFEENTQIIELDNGRVLVSEF